MKRRKLNLKLKAWNWKTIIIVAIVIMLVIAGTYAVRHFMNDDKEVPFEVLSEEMIPQKIQDIMPRYKNLERALACKVNDEVYVIATRGEKPTGGYTIVLDRIEKVQDDDEKTRLIVYTTFEDPEPGSIVTQALTYPYVVAKTNLTELPDKIELKVKYED